jgi:hypothetical protein
MKRQDLKASVIVAVAWLLGVTMYSMWKGPALSEEASDSVYNALQPLPVADQIYADERAPKHLKMPVRWAHQRWGAV